MQFQSTPSVGRATQPGRTRKRRKVFQSTPSVGRATVHAPFSLASSSDFNPRPPWGGRRSIIRAQALLLGDFNPRPPWGGRLLKSCPVILLAINFNPRPPWGGRRYNFCIGHYDFSISIHALRGEGDAPPTCCSHIKRSHFNPRPPWGGRRRRHFRRRCMSHHVNPRPPGGGRHVFANVVNRDYEVQSTPSVGRATAKLHNARQP